MGYMVHHAIVVTGMKRSEWMSPEWLCAEDAHAFALEAAARNGGACEVTPLTPESTNGYRSFMVAPDGSKEGWATSAEGDETRREIIEWLRSNGAFSFAEIKYGDEECRNALLAHDGETVEA